MGSATSEHYDDIPYRQLPIDAVDWAYTTDHIQNRSRRKRRPEFDVQPEWATEAALNFDRLVQNSGSRSGESIAVIGFSSTADRILVVILVPKDHPPGGEWWGASAWAANEKDSRVYEAQKGSTSAGERP
ncbi:MAG: hypothetical protein ACREN8_06995 [Candidatus Dormibacteraceae bacterium]